MWHSGDELQRQRSGLVNKMEMQIKCQRQGVLAQSPEPEAHDKALDSSRSNWNLEMLGFEEGGKQGTWRKTFSEQGREPKTNSTHI